MGLHEQAVVDPFLRVYGTEKLRVVDAMIAERPADLIREHVPETSTLLHLFALADWHLTHKLCRSYGVPAALRSFGAR